MTQGGGSYLGRLLGVGRIKLSQGGHSLLQFAFGSRNGCAKSTLVIPTSLEFSRRLRSMGDEGGKIALLLEQSAPKSVNRPSVNHVIAGLR